MALAPTPREKQENRSIANPIERITPGKNSSNISDQLVSDINKKNPNMSRIPGGGSGRGNKNKPEENVGGNQLNQTPSENITADAVETKRNDNLRYTGRTNNIRQSNLIENRTKDLNSDSRGGDQLTKSRSENLSSDLVEINRRRLSNESNRNSSSNENISRYVPTKEEALKEITKQKPTQKFSQFNNEDIKNNDFYVNPKTGMPYRVVTVPKTIKEQFKEATKDRNIVSGTLYFLGEKTQGKLDKFERANAPQGQSLASTGAISTGVQVAPYLNPITAPSFALATGAATFTPSGQREVEQTSKAVSELTEGKVSSKVTKTGLNVLAATGVLTGGLQTVKQVEKLSGYPKYETIFLSRQNVNMNQDGKNLLMSKQVAQTTQKGLVSNKNFISAGESRVLTSSNEEGLTNFAAGTRGVSREIKYQLPTSKKVYSKPLGFGGKEVGQIKEQEVNVLISRVKGLDIRKNAKGGSVISVGETASYKKGAVPNKFVNRGAFVNTGEKESILASESRDVIIDPITKRVTFLKTGQSKSIGKIISNEEGAESFGITGSATKQVKGNINPQSIADKSFVKAVESNIAKESLAKDKSIIKVTKNVNKGLNFGSPSSSSVSQSSSIEVKPVLKSNIVQSNKQESVIKSIPALKVTPSVSTKTRASSLNVQSNKQESVIKSIPALKVTPSVSTKTRNLPAVRSLIKKAQDYKTRQLYNLKTKSVVRTPKVGLPSLSSALSKVQKKKSLSSSEGFDVFTRKGNKEVRLFENLPEGLALKRGSEEVRKTLRASFYLKPSGRTTSREDISFSLDSNMFRPGKRVKGFVERSKYRLDKASERSEINIFKQTKKRGKFF